MKFLIMINYSLIKMNCNLLLVMLFVAFSLKAISQENKLKFKSVSLSYGGFQPAKGPNTTANFYASIDASMSIKKNMFSVSLNRGFDLEVLGTGSRYNLELGFLYGLKFKLYKWVFLEAHAGIGYFQGSYYKYNSETWEDRWGFIKSQNNTKNNIRLGSISFPIKTKLLFYMSKYFSLGAAINISINKISSLSAYGIVFQKTF